MHDRFRMDKQTFEDLEIFEHQGRSVFASFDFTVTAVGREVLQEIFRTPLTDAVRIRERQAETSFCLLHNLHFSLEPQLIADVSKYWMSTADSAHDATSDWWKGLCFWTSYTSSFYYKRRYIQETVYILQQLSEQLAAIHIKELPNVPWIFRESEARIHRVLNLLIKHRDRGKTISITPANIDRYDRIIRNDIKGDLQYILNYIYQLDACCAVSKAVHTYGLTFPRIIARKEPIDNNIQIKGLHHIFQKDAIRNDVIFESTKNIWFLTGANMAGKSTFIKAFSIAVYLAHTGLPVPASSMTIPILDGLYTTINIADDLSAGYSQFYHEAIRLRDIALNLNTPSRALIVFDELFKGTNYQDAYQATERVLRLLSDIQRPYVIISSHLTELAQELTDKQEVRVCRMAANVDKSGKVTFPYICCDGVAQEKLGMWLLAESGAFQALHDKAQHSDPTRKK